MGIRTLGQVLRRDIPGEAGQWMEFQRLSTRQLSQRPDLSTKRWSELSEAEQVALSLRWMEACVVGWSFEAPCAAESMGDLVEPMTAIWAGTTAAALTMGGESREEKKADSPSSTPS